MQKQRQVVKRVLEQITPLYFFSGLCIVSLLIMIMGTCSMYDIDGPLPPPRDPPPPAEKSIVLSYRYKEGFYHSLIDEDCKKLGLKKIDLNALKKGHRYFAEFSGNQLLRPGNKLETSHLLLEAMNKKIWVGQQGQGYRTEHLVLRITNKTNRYLAYLVLTQVKGACSTKGPIQQNALALKPKQRITRTECLAREIGGIRIRRVEVLELSPLGYYYVSRLDPVQIGYSARTSEGHQVTKLPLCKIIPWRLIKQSIKKGETRWYDVIDFYSRHSCNEYSFFKEYRWQRTGPSRLPSKPPEDQ